MALKNTLRVVMNEEEKMILKEAIKIVENTIFDYENIMTSNFDEEVIDPYLDLLIKKAIMLENQLIWSDFNDIGEHNRSVFIHGVIKDIELLETAAA